MIDLSQFRTSAGTPAAVPTQTAVAAGRWDDTTITYVTVTQDRLFNNRRNFPIILPHVDRVVAVDGFSKDGTYEYLQALPRVEVYQREWDDSFANQYNEYLKHIKGGWVLLCDDDEVPSEPMLVSLRQIVQEVGDKCGVVEFRANDISYIEGKWENRVDNGPCEYYRQIFFKWFPDMHYAVNLHQALQGMRGPVLRRQEHYYHIKSTKDEYRNACRNYFIAGEWPSGSRSDGIKTPEWQELKGLLAEHHPKTPVFGHMNALMITGDLHPTLVEWIKKHRDHNTGVEGESSGELRAFARYWDLLHPEQV